MPRSATKTHHHHTAAERHPQLVAGADDRLLTRREVEVECALSQATIYRGIAAGTFPRPKKVGRQAVRWPSSAIAAWKDRQSLTESRA